MPFDNQMILIVLVYGIVFFIILYAIIKKLFIDRIKRRLKVSDTYKICRKVLKGLSGIQVEKESEDVCGGRAFVSVYGRKYTPLLGFSITASKSTILTSLIIGRVYISEWQNIETLVKRYNADKYNQFEIRFRDDIDESSYLVVLYKDSTYKSAYELKKRLFKDKEFAVGVAHGYTFSEDLSELLTKLRPIIE